MVHNIDEEGWIFVDTGTLPASYAMVSCGFFPGVKAAGAST